MGNFKEASNIFLQALANADAQRKREEEMAKNREFTTNERKATQTWTETEREAMQGFQNSQRIANENWNSSFQEKMAGINFNNQVALSENAYDHTKALQDDQQTWQSIFQPQQMRLQGQIERENLNYNRNMPLTINGVKTSYGAAPLQMAFNQDRREQGGYDLGMQRVNFGRRMGNFMSMLSDEGSRPKGIAGLSAMSTEDGYTFNEMRDKFPQVEELKAMGGGINKPVKPWAMKLDEYLPGFSWAPELQDLMTGDIGAYEESQKIYQKGRNMRIGGPIHKIIGDMGNSKESKIKFAKEAVQR